MAQLTSTGVSMVDPDAATVRAEDGLATFDWPQILSALDDVRSLDGPADRTDVISH